MAFPTIPTVAASRVLSVLATNPAGTHTSPSLTTLVNNAGDLLIAIVIIYDGNSTNAEFSAWGGGFTEFADQAGTATMGIGLAYKFSDGTETGTFTVTSADASANDSAFFLLSIPGASAVTPPEATAMAVGTAPDAASLNPAGWGTEDTLWIAVGGSGEDSLTGAYTGIGTAPTNYTDQADSGISADAVGGVEGSVAFRQLNAASEDPGTWSMDTSNARGSALLIAVRPITPSTVSPTGGVASAEAIGSHTLVPVASIIPAGVAGAEAVGSHTLLPGPVVVVPTGVGSAEALGAAIVYSLSSIIPGAIASNEAFGAHILLPGGVSVVVSAIGSAEVVPSPILAGLNLVLPGAIASNEAVSSPVLYAIATIIANAIGSAEAVANPVLLPGGVAVQVSAIGSAEQLGSATLLPGQVQIVVNGIASGELFGLAIVEIAGGGPAAAFIDPTGIAGLEAFGGANLYTVALVTPLAIGSDESFGAISVIPGAVQITVTGLSSDEAVSIPVIHGSYTILPSAIATDEAVGVPVLYARAIISPDAIDATGDFGLAALLPGEVLIQVTSVSSGEVIGLAIVTHASLQTAIQWAHSASFGDSRHKSFTTTQSRFGKTRRDQ